MGEMEIKGSGSYFSDFGGRRCLAHPQALEGRVLDASAAHSSLVMFFFAAVGHPGPCRRPWCALVCVGVRSFCQLLSWSSFFLLARHEPHASHSLMH